MQELIGKCIVAPPCLLPEPGNGAKGMVSDHHYFQNGASKVYGFEDGRRAFNMQLQQLLTLVSVFTASRTQTAGLLNLLAIQPVASYFNVVWAKCTM